MRFISSSHTLSIKPPLAETAELPMPSQAASSQSKTNAVSYQSKKKSLTHMANRASTSAAGPIANFFYL